ncbi:MAG: PEGA domain-containing protein [Archangiaceae bacterium]|nr:PEGA domain-containing protein [Archangiaceae bacterium]
MLTLVLTAFLAAGGPATLTIEVKPEASVVKVDGKKVGTGAKPISIKLPAGKHTIRCELKGDATTDEVTLKAGEKKTWKWEFTGTEKTPSTTDPVVPEGGEEAPK